MSTNNGILREEHGIAVKDKGLGTNVREHG